VIKQLRPYSKKWTLRAQCLTPSKGTVLRRDPVLHAAGREVATAHTNFGPPEEGRGVDPRDIGISFSDRVFRI